jgi:hypothetical protein
MTVSKAGFVFSARAGSGVVIAKLPDGSWSAPSAIGTAGGGVGFQAGVELAEFLIILNSRKAVKSFMAKGSLTLCVLLICSFPCSTRSFLLFRPSSSPSSPSPFPFFVLTQFSTVAETCPLQLVLSVATSKEPEPSHRREQRRCTPILGRKGSSVEQALRDLSLSSGRMRTVRRTATSACLLHPILRSFSLSVFRRAFPLPLTAPSRLPRSLLFD